MTAIALFLFGLIVLLLLTALLMKKRHYVKCSIEVDVPASLAYDFLRFLKNQERFNKWAKTDPNRKVSSVGDDGTIGYKYIWKDDKSAGEGEKEIVGLVVNEKIETVLRFIRPMSVTAFVTIETQNLSEKKSLVSLINFGQLNFPLNLLIPFAEKNFANDMNESLQNLKSILEEEFRV
jgi:hypothetical protein